MTDSRQQENPSLSFEEMRVQLASGMRPNGNLKNGQFTMAEVAEVVRPHRRELEKRYAMDKRCPVLVDNVTDETPVSQIIEALRLPTYHKAIYLLGGAKNFSEELRERVEKMLIYTLLQVAKKSQGKVLVGSGGTESGIMDIAGRARYLAGALDHEVITLGIFPKESVAYPGNIPSDPYPAQIDDDHTHYVAVSAGHPLQAGESAWGQETPTMYRVFNELGKDIDSIAICVNGGVITANEAIENLTHKRKIFALEGSGRFADVLAAIAKGEESSINDGNDEEKKKLLQHFSEKIRELGITTEEIKDHVVVIDMNDQKTTMYSLFYATEKFLTNKE